jgi:hypothetical protein
MKLSITRIIITKEFLHVFWTTLQIILLIIGKIKIQLDVNYEIVKIDDVAYNEFFNLSVYESIREKLFKK